MDPLTCHDTVATPRQTAVRYLFPQYCHTVILLSKGQVAASAGQIGYQMKFKDTPQHSAASREHLRLSGRLKLKTDETKTLRRGVKRSTLEKQPWPDTQLVPTYLLQVPKLRCRKRVCPGSLPDFAKGIKVQESCCTSSNRSRSFLRGS